MHAIAVSNPGSGLLYKLVKFVFETLFAPPDYTKLSFRVEDKKGYFFLGKRAHGQVMSKSEAMKIIMDEQSAGKMSIKDYGRVRLEILMSNLPY